MAYPIVLELKDRLIVVIGGGSVAVRKVQGLLSSGAARIRLVAPKFDPQMPANSDVIQQIADRYEAAQLDGASLVFAATDSAEVNEAIVRDARRIGALACRADVDDENGSDFATPAMLRNGPLLVTVSSGGSPALSAMIRDRLASAIDPRWAQMAGAMQSLRPALRRALRPARRRQAFHDLCSDQALDQLQSNGLDGLKCWLHDKYPELSDKAPKA